MSARILVLLCVVALQLQLVASSTMTCKYARFADEMIGGACPLHLGATAPPGLDKTASMLDCQKCVLCLFFGACHKMASASPQGLPSVPPIEGGGVHKHFYDFTPGQPNRPPISHPS